MTLDIETIAQNYRPQPDTLLGRVILITGAGAGIGAELAVSSAACGATVILLGKTISRLENTYDRIVALERERPSIYPMDLLGATPRDYEELANVLGKEFGRLDGLVHNAGVLGDRSQIEHYDPVVWAKTLQVNLNAPFLLTQACLPLLKISKDASVIFVSSGVGRKGRAYWGAYACSKFGIEGLSQILADETEKNTAIRSNCVNPGATRTAMRKVAYPGEDPESVKAPQEILSPYLYLLGPDSRGVTGQSLDCQAKKQALPA
jgi:NAD(P)-dependent dehydrogenase (short-subunit alcohol dehydrogenase family)